MIRSLQFIGFKTSWSKNAEEALTSAGKPPGRHFLPRKWTGPESVRI